jgi:hypothetical protein
MGLRTAPSEAVMKRITWDVTLELEGPIASASTAIGRFGIDLSLAKTNNYAGSGERRIYLPGTQIKGLLREAWEELEFKGVTDWLGQGSPGLSGAEPNRGRLNFSDFLDLTTDPDIAHPIRYRTKIDPYRGSVEEGALLLIESPYDSGQTFFFCGSISTLLKDDESEADIERRLRAALNWIPAVGAERTVGFGTLKLATVSERRVISHSSGQVSNERTKITLQLDRPFCFGNRRVHHNVFDSEPFIPGGAIKAVIAEQAAHSGRRFQELLNHLDKVVISYLFPKTSKGRQSVWPLSLVRRGGEVFDACLLKNAPAGWSADLRFQVDWKPSEQEVPGYPTIDPDREVRVRTAIDGEKRKAKDEQLFGYRAIAPDIATEWEGYLDLTKVPKGARDAVQQQMTSLLEFGLMNLGKTKACTRKMSFSAANILSPQFGAEVAITLQTSALLVAPDKKQPNESALEFCFRLYQKAWNDISAETLTLSHFYQASDLWGEEYVHRRFQKAIPNGDGRYRPYWLTRAGSVFVFKVNPGGADRIAEWQRTHLPLPKAVKSFYQLPAKDAWKFCPCLPENGYGEIHVNLHETAGVRRLEGSDVQ